MANSRSEKSARAEQMRKEREKSDRRQRNVITIVIVGVVGILVALGGFAIANISEENRANDEVIEPNNLTDTGVDFPADAGATNTDAPLVEVFEDFLCPVCGQFEQANGDRLMQQAADGEIQLRFRPFSFLHNASSNDYSRRATNLAMCAVDEGGADDFWKVHSALYENQPAEGGAGPENDDLIATADAAGVTVSDSCVRTERFVPWIDRVKERDQEERDISGTPTVIIDGNQVEDISPQGLDAAITAAASQ